MDLQEAIYDLRETVKLLERRVAVLGRDVRELEADCLSLTKASLDTSKVLQTHTDQLECMFRRAEVKPVTLRRAANGKG